MVSSKVKSAMGLQKSSAKQHQLKKCYGGIHFTRSFGVYFPRFSAQVQPRPPDAAELLRVIEELRERESRLKTAVVEQKLLRESAAIVPFLENEVAVRDLEIERLRKKIDCVELENERVRNENEVLQMELTKQNQKYEEKIEFMQGELLEIKKAVEEREQEQSSSSSAQSGYKSGFTIKRLRKCVTQNNIASNFCESGRNRAQLKTEIEVKKEENTKHPEEIPEPSERLLAIRSRSRAPRVPKPPPIPSASISSSLSGSGDRALAEISNIPPPPLPPLKTAAPLGPLPPPPPPPPQSQSKAAAPPPPPPMPPKELKSKRAAAKVTRVPEVVEFYHSLMRRDANSRRESGGVASDALSAGRTTKDMIGEIENRSSHLLAIKTDVETQGDFIRFLIKEVEGAAFTDIEDVVPFVKWLDDELSYLVDERAVLKHFNWPEQKADALREAAFGYGDFKKLESEVSSFMDDSRKACGLALKKMQSLFEKLEHGVYNLSRMRESTAKRCKLYHIPMDWMQDSGYVSKIKLASVKLAMKYMKRVSSELGMVVNGGPEEEELIVQGVKFAFRVHQFAGGFDVETMKAFQELRDKAEESCQNQQHHKFVSRSQ